MIRPATSTVTGFHRQAVWPVWKLSLPFTLEDYTGRRRKTILAKFIIIRAKLPYNVLFRRTGLWQLQVVASTVHGLLKFPTDEGIITVRRVTPKFKESNTTIQSIAKEDSQEAKVVINPMHPDQPIRLGTKLPSQLKNGIVTLLQKYMDVFAWSPQDMTGIPRVLIKHKLSVNPAYIPIKQKKIMAKERNEVVNKEVAELVKTNIIRPT